MTTDTQPLTDRIDEHLARPVRPPVYVEIVDPSGRVSYRRWSDHPDVQEALGTQGYTVRRCPQQPDLDGEAHPDRALLAEAQAELRAQAEALAAEREQVSLYRLDNEGHMECLAETHRDLLRELPDSETTALLGRMLDRWQRTPGQRQYVALSEVENAALYAVVSETSQGYRFDGLHTQPEGAQQHQREVIAAEAGKLVMTDVYALVRVQKQEDAALGGQS
ncbi:hypothetical protein DM785_02345 [Deinococcus actinosclerus]|nr:hypothetical protein DM785_02345 [Deinococcus actinosclerus]